MQDIVVINDNNHININMLRMVSFTGSDNVFSNPKVERVGN